MLECFPVPGSLSEAGRDREGRPRPGNTEQSPVLQSESRTSCASHTYPGLKWGLLALDSLVILLPSTSLESDPVFWGRPGLLRLPGKRKVSVVL